MSAKAGKPQNQKNRSMWEPGTNLFARGAHRPTILVLV